MNTVQMLPGVQAGTEGSAGVYVRGVGLLSGKFQVEGPIVSGCTSFNLSARHSYWDLVAKPFMNDEEKFDYFFYDLNAKVNHQFQPEVQTSE